MGWLGYIEGDQGRGVEFWVTLDGQCIPNIHCMPSVYGIDPGALPSLEGTEPAAERPTPAADDSEQVGQ